MKGPEPGSRRLAKPLSGLLAAMGRPLPYPGAAPTSPGLHKLPTSTSSVPGGVASDTTGASTRGSGGHGRGACASNRQVGANQKPSTQTTRSHPKHPRGLLRPGPPSTHFHKERYPLCALRAELGRGTLNATPPPRDWAQRRVWTVECSAAPLADEACGPFLFPFFSPPSSFLSWGSTPPPHRAMPTACSGPAPPHRASSGVIAQWEHVHQ